VFNNDNNNDNNNNNDYVRNSWESLRIFLREKCATKIATTTNAWILSGNKDCTKHLGLQRTRSIPIKTADQDLRYIHYEIYNKNNNNNSTTARSSNDDDDDISEKKKWRQQEQHYPNDDDNDDDRQNFRRKSLDDDYSNVRTMRSSSNKPQQRLNTNFRVVSRREISGRRNDYDYDSSPRPSYRNGSKPNSSSSSSSSSSRNGNKENSNGRSRKNKNNKKFATKASNNDTTNDWMLD
jgi:hypothetical protein